jgi:hypothetical protein
MTAPWPRTEAEVSAASCLFDTDKVPKQPEVTAFKRRARWQQAWWRESQGLPIGNHRSGDPMVERPNGSRVELEHAKQTGCNFLSPAIRDAVDHRLGHQEPDQTLNEDRLWSDLLSSMPMCFNLFGALHGNQQRLTATTEVLWPGHPGSPTEIRFEWSPGRLDKKYLGNRSAFDAAVLLDLGDGTRGVIGIETKYHENIRREKAPDEEGRMTHYRKVADSSGVFKSGWEDQVKGTALQQIWLDHLLVLSMVQQPTEWKAGRFVLVYPAANPSVPAAADRYRDLLTDDTTFATVTVEELLDAHVLHEPDTEAKFRQRYLWDA